MKCLTALMALLVGCTIPVESNVHIDACLREDSLIARFDEGGELLAVDTVWVGRCVVPDSAIVP